MRKKAVFNACLLVLAFVWFVPEYCVIIQTAEGGFRREHDRRDRRRDERRHENTQQPQIQAQTSDYAGDIVNLTNAERRKAGFRNLGIDDELMAAASLRARELVSEFDHRRPDGRSWDTVLREYRVRSYNSWGENILYNMSDKPAEAMNQWMNSSGHHTNILSKNFTHIGVGVHRNGGRTYVVQIFVGR